MKDILEKIHHKIGLLEGCLQYYEEAMEKLGLKPIDKMSISEKVETAEFICQIRNIDGKN